MVITSFFCDAIHDSKKQCIKLFNTNCESWTLLCQGWTLTAAWTMNHNPDNSLNSYTYTIWAVTWQNQQSECTPSEDSDQPGHPPSLIRVFAVRMKKPWVLSYPLSAQRRLWSDWADAQADLSLCWAYTHFVGFVMSRLICISTVKILEIRTSQNFAVIILKFEQHGFNNYSERRA